MQYHCYNEQFTKNSIIHNKHSTRFEKYRCTRLIFKATSSLGLYKSQSLPVHYSSKCTGHMKKQCIAYSPD